MIYKMLNSSFYYGEFEYPKNSGKWYKGNHEALITKELFEQVQKAIAELFINNTNIDDLSLETVKDEFEIDVGVEW